MIIPGGGAAGCGGALGSISIERAHCLSLSLRVSEMIEPSPPSLEALSAMLVMT